MIYLIDDNLSNQQFEYGCQFIQEGKYEEILHYKKCIKTTERLAFYEKFISDATLLLIHGTSKDADANGSIIESTDVVEKLIEICEGKKSVLNISKEIPYVKFSNGHTTAPVILNNNITDINKKFFYLNLRPFLDDYIKNNKFDLNIIEQGQYYKKYNLIEKGKKIIDIIEKKDQSFIYICNLDHEFDILLSNFLNASLSKINFESFIELYSGKINGNSLKDLISKAIISIYKYGKNIYY